MCDTGEIKLSKKEYRQNKIKEEIEPLINKTVYYNGNLYKISHYNNIYIYVNEYEQDDELILNTDIIFMFYGTSQTYRHFNDKLIKQVKPNKIKISVFYGYIICNYENIKNYYYIDNKQYDNYYDSNFYNNKQFIKLLNTVDKFFYSLLYSPLRDINNSYYKPYRDTELIKHFTTTFKTLILKEDDKIKIFNKLNEKYTLYNLYDVYNELYEEYKLLTVSKE